MATNCLAIKKDKEWMRTHNKNSNKMTRKNQVRNCKTSRMKMTATVIFDRLINQLTTNILLLLKNFLMKKNIFHFFSLIKITHKLQMNIKSQNKNNKSCIKLKNATITLSLKKIQLQINIE